MGWRITQELSLLGRNQGYPCYQPLLDSSRKESSEGVTMAFGDAEKTHTPGGTGEDIYKRGKVKSHSEDSGH